MADTGWIRPDIHEDPNAVINFAPFMYDGNIATDATQNGASATTLKVYFSRVASSNLADLLPSNAIPVGIEIRFTYKAEGASSPARSRKTVYDRQALANIADAADAGALTSLVPAQVTIGGATDLFGLTTLQATRALFIDTDTAFGFDINIGFSQIFHIYEVEFKIHYELQAVGGASSNWWRSQLTGNL